MSETPVTVLMTVRNGEPYVEEAVRSVLSQTYGDFTFLILDNRSTDRTREVVRDFRDPRVRLIELDCDLGQTGALNRGLTLLDTPYVARMDADDVSHPSRLERQMAFFREHPDVALLGTWFEAIGPEGRIIGQHRPPVEHEEILKGMLFENQFLHSSVIYSRSAVMALGGYDPSYNCAQDYALWWQIALKHTVANLPELLTQFRTHSGQTSHTFKQKVPLELYSIVKAALDNPSLAEEARPLIRRARGYSYLRYAAGISEIGQGFKSCIWLMRGILKAPYLLTEQASMTHISRVFRGWTRR